MLLASVYQEAAIQRSQTSFEGPIVFTIMVKNSALPIFYVQWNNQRLNNQQQPLA
jgi:hypothetical protein